MVKIVWSPNSLKDLNQIFEYIARDSIDYAKQVISGISDAKNRLKKFPRSGRIVPELNQQNIREIIYSSYRIIFQIHSDLIIMILTIVHCSRNLRI